MQVFSNIINKDQPRLGVIFHESIQNDTIGRIYAETIKTISLYLSYTQDYAKEIRVYPCLPTGRRLIRVIRVLLIRPPRSY